MDYIDALAAKPAGKPAIKNYLDLSTAHLTAETRDLLDDLDGTPAAWPAMSIFPGEYGWVITVPPIGEPTITELVEQMKALPQDLAGVLHYVAAQGCELVRFDADGGYVDVLPTYEK